MRALPTRATRSRSSDCTDEPLRGVILAWHGGRALMYVVYAVMVRCSFFRSSLLGLSVCVRVGWLRERFGQITECYIESCVCACTVLRRLASFQTSHAASQHSPLTHSLSLSFSHDGSTHLHSSQPTSHARNTVAGALQETRVGMTCSHTPRKERLTVVLSCPSSLLGWRRLVVIIVVLVFLIIRNWLRRRRRRSTGLGWRGG
jgi:hypothetical protein